MGLLSFTGKVLGTTAKIALSCAKEATNNITEKQNEVKRASMRDLQRYAERDNLLGDL